MRTFFKAYKTPLIFLMLLLLAGGYYAFQQIQTALFPQITFPKIKVIADNGDQPVDKMMVTVTRPLEEAIKRIPDLKGIRSTTSRGSCEISAFLDWNANVYTSQQLIESRIAAIRQELPAGLQLTIERMNPSILPVVRYSLEGKDMSLMRLKLIAEYTAKPFLSQVEGVSAIRVQGGKTKEYWMELSQKALLKYGLTPKQVQQAVAGADFIQSNGFMNNYRRLYLTLTDAALYHIQDIENLVVKQDPVNPILVKDVAKIEVHDKIEYVKINANGHEGVLLNVLKQPNANLIQVTDSVDQKIAELKYLLPAGVTLKPLYHQADFVNNSIKSIRDALLIGLALAILVAILFLRSLYASITVLVIIPVTLSSALLIMLGLGYTLNIMTIGAIAAAIGLVIDDAVVVIEQIHRTREEHPDDPVFPVIKKSMRYLMPSLVSSSLSTIVIFIPFTLMTGVAGAYFKILAYTMIITLVCSFIVVSMILPAFYGNLVHYLPTRIKKVEHKERQAWVDFLIHKPFASIFFIALMIGAGVYCIPRLQTGFLPEMDEGTIVLDYNSPPGTSIEETDHMLQQVERLIMNTPEVVGYSRRTGTQMGFFITEPNRGDYQIRLKDKRKRSTQEVIADIRHRIEARFPALTVDFGQVIGDMLGDLMESAQPIEVKVFGPDEQKIKDYAKQVAAQMEQVPGTADVFDGLVVAGPNITFRPKRESLARFGLSVSDLQFQLKTRLEGQVVGNVLDKNQLTSVRMIFPEGPKQKLEALEEAPFLLPSGQYVPLKKLVDIHIQKGVTEQERENLQPIVAVTSRIEGSDLGTVIQRIKKRVKDHIQFEKGYGVRYGGAYAEQQQSFKELMTILILASLLVLIVQLAMFRDLKVAVTILVLGILGIGGAVLALYVTGTPLNVGSYTGIIMIVGIIAENAVFTYQQYQTALEDHDKDGAVNFAIAARLRPKLMTALGAIIALMPLALGIGTGAQLHQPLAIAVIGGFLAALPLLLIVFPSVIRLFPIKKEKE